MGRKLTYKGLFKKAASAWSRYIRYRDGQCVTCGSKTQLQCGHLITRSKKSIFFDPENCNVQCAKCNIKHEYNPEIYTAWFINRFGLSRYNDLILRGNQTKKWTDEELREIIAKCEAVVK